MAGGRLRRIYRTGFYLDATVARNRSHLADSELGPALYDVRLGLQRAVFDRVVVRRQRRPWDQVCGVVRVEWNTKP